MHSNLEAFPSPLRDEAQLGCAQECRIALNNASSPNGFVKNSTAPAFMALTVMGTSP
jgi:hypothetical protein